MSDTLSNRRRKEIASLTQKKYRERLSQMLVEGRRSVVSAVDAGAPLVDVLVARSAADEREIRRILSRVDVPVYAVADEELEEISTVETSQGILAVASIEQISADALASSARVLVLDGLQDPGNAGTILRTAAWFGVDAVVTARGTVDLYNPKVVRATMGALWDVAHAHVEDLVDVLAGLSDKGFSIYAADMEGSDVRMWRPEAKSVLVLGSEGHGLSPDVASMVGERIVIPGAATRQGTESLNVAVAAAILMYEWTG